MEEDSFRTWIADRLAGYDASHDLVHADNVARLAARICAAEGVGATVRTAAHFAALAHDLCDRKYCKAEEAAARLDALRVALLRCRVPADVATLVVRVVPLISFTRLARDGVPAHLEGDALAVFRVVSDADMLEAMGVCGVVRTHMFQAVSGRTSAGAHAYVRDYLLTYVDHLHHAWARAEGAERHARMLRICTEYERERDPL